MATYSSFLSASGQTLEKAFWPCEGQTKGLNQPKAVVQLVHGMAEHIRRYEATAQALNRAGYAVVGHSHAGHGPYTQTKGYFGKTNGWDTLIADVHTVRMETQKQFPGVPYVLMGHSMGSFVTRGYCLKHEDGLAGVVLSGTRHSPKAEVLAASAVANVQIALGLGEKPGKLLEKLSSGGNNKRYEDVQTPFDWLSRDREAVAKYVADPLCGFTFTVRAYRDMFDGLSRLYPEKLGAMRPDIPILLLAGDMDPVGAYGEGVKKVAQELRAAGVKDVSVQLYAGGRHEMLNELNKEIVWADLIAWLDQHV